MIHFTSLISGSSGNSTYISDGKTHILVDCGMSGKQLAESLSKIGVSPDSIDALLITHEHSDHVRGAGVAARRYGIPVYATEGTFSSMNVGNVENFIPINPDTELEIGTIGVMPFSIPHDAKDPVGYSFYIENKKLSIATDMGHMYDELIEKLFGSNMIILESNHDVEMLRIGPYPFPLKQRILGNLGHLSNEICAQTALRLIEKGTEHIMLGHLSIENNRPEIAMMETYNTLCAAGVNVGKDVTLKVADRYKATKFETE